MLLVPVSIGDRIVTMMVDTGAAFTTLTPRAATRLGLDLSGFVRRVPIFAAGGATIELTVGQVRSLRVGAAELHDVDVGLMAFRPGSPLTGSSALTCWLGSARPSIFAAPLSFCVQSHLADTLS